MCSITKHCTLSSNFSASLARPQPTASSLSSNVYLLSCLYVVSSDALRSSVFTDLRRGGACNQGERFFIFILVASLVDTRSVACVSVTMKQCVSVSMCTHYTFKKVRAKKNPSCDESFLICPIGYAHWYSF